MNIGPALEVRRYQVPIDGLRVGDRGLRIAHVSDFHFRQWHPVLDQARWRLLRTDYDLLLVTGDFCSISRKWRHAASMCRRFFDGIRPRLGTYAVLGNHDAARLSSQQGLPFRWLTNEHIRLRINSGALYLAGVDQSQDQFGDVDAALDGIPVGEPTILLAHYPSTAFDLTPGRVQLMLSGHTHGGQIRLPRVGCLFTNDRIPTRMASGLHNIDGTLVHVSAGIGVSGPLPWRINCPADIGLIALPSANAYVRTPTTSGEHHLAETLMPV